MAHETGATAAILQSSMQQQVKNCSGSMSSPCRVKQSIREYETCLIEVAINRFGSFFLCKYQPAV
jgi:hypothetical protein